jgi:hypothetical protein
MGEIWGYNTDRLFTANDFNGNNGVVNPTWVYGSKTPNQDALNNSSAFHFGPGDIKYQDTDGNGVVNFGKGTNLDHGDMHVIGNTTPRYIYGLRLGLNYKGFDASAFVQGVGKRDYWEQVHSLFLALQQQRLFTKTRWTIGQRRIPMHSILLHQIREEIITTLTGSHRRGIY